MLYNISLNPKIKDANQRKLFYGNLHQNMIRE